MNLKSKIQGRKVNARQETDTNLLHRGGKLNFGRKLKISNKHIVFDTDTDWNTTNYDELNALVFPNRTVNYLTKYTEEKINIPKEHKNMNLCGRNPSRNIDCKVSKERGKVATIKRSISRIGGLLGTSITVTGQDQMFILTEFGLLHLTLTFQCGLIRIKIVMSVAVLVRSSLLIYRKNIDFVNYVFTKWEVITYGR